MKDTINYKLVGTRISDWRKRLNITQDDLAFLTGISIPYISEIENGKKRPSLDIIVAVSDAIGVTVDELLSGNMLSSSSDYQTDIDYLLSDCTSEERQFIYEMLRALKESLRQNKWSINNEKIQIT